MKLHNEKFHRVMWAVFSSDTNCSANVSRDLIRLGEMTSGWRVAIDVSDITVLAFLCKSQKLVILSGGGNPAYDT